MSVLEYIKAKDLFEALGDAVVVVAEDGTIKEANAEAAALFGYEPGELVGRPIEVLVPEGKRPQHNVQRDGYFSAPRTRAMGSGLAISGLKKDGTEFPVDIRLSYKEVGSTKVAFAAIRDATATRRNEELVDLRARLEKSNADLAKVNDEITRANADLARANAELACHVLPVWEGVLVSPVVGVVDSQRTAQLMEAILNAVVAHSASVVIVDLTGVSVLDTQTAKALLDCAAAVRLLGARAILTGLRPEVAQACVSLGIDLSAIEPYGTLMGGLAAAIGGTREVAAPGRTKSS